MAVFSFTLDSFQITDTRSLHNDTDYVTFTLAVGGKPQTLKKSMGDVNNGLHGVNLSFPNVTVNPADTVVLNYLIVNTGNKNPGNIESTLESAGVKLAMEAGDALGIPALGSALGKVATWLGGEIISILNTLCDGAVAAEQDKFTYNDLVAKTANGPFSQSTKHPGTNSPTGCGRNSMYIVNWHMVEVGNPKNATVPGVVNDYTGQAASLVQAAGLVPKYTGANPDPKKTWVFSQSPVAGTIVAKGSPVTMVLHTGPLP